MCNSFAFTTSNQGLGDYLAQIKNKENLNGKHTSRDKSHSNQRPRIKSTIKDTKKKPKQLNLTTKQEFSGNISFKLLKTPTSCVNKKFKDVNAPNRYEFNIFTL